MISKKDKEILKLFGENLKKIRKEKGYTLRSLSYECDIDYSDINKIEKGQKNITLTTVIELAKGLAVQPKKILDFEIDMD
jgi:transcriptional regulator with XRE-family HTH domain